MILDGDILLERGSVLAIEDENCHFWVSIGLVDDNE